MKKLTENEILERLEEWRNTIKTELRNLWVKRDERVYKRIMEFIKIFFAKEISSGPIKEDISRLVLSEWLMGINQAATSVKDHYVMKATTQLIAMIEEPEEIDRFWLPTAENINALPEPVRNYIADMQTNADPPSMVADNIIMKDTIKALEKKLEEKAEDLAELMRSDDGSI